MPRELTTEEKARAVLARTGQPGNRCAGLTNDELVELAAVYDQCVAPELRLADLVASFWGRRQERLDAAKATDTVQPEAQATRKSFFRNRPKVQ